MDCCSPGSSVHGTFQARVLEWGAIIAFSADGAASAAELLQSCLTLCDRKDGSPPGSPVPGTLQARILEWIAISFSQMMLRTYFSSCRCMWHSYTCAELQLPHLSPIIFPHTSRRLAAALSHKYPNPFALRKTRSETSSPLLAALPVNPLRWKPLHLRIWLAAHGAKEPCPVTIPITQLTHLIRGFSAVAGLSFHPGSPLEVATCYISAAAAASITSFSPICNLSPVVLRSMALCPR